MSLMSEKSPVNYLQRLIISSPDPLKSNDNHKLELQIQAYLKDQFLFKLKNWYSQSLKLEKLRFWLKIELTILTYFWSKNWNCTDYLPFQIHKYQFDFFSNHEIKVSVSFSFYCWYWKIVVVSVVYNMHGCMQP